jgi:hypothetical protein
MAEVLERGNIYFVFRPKVEHTSAEGLEDIQRFFLILSPYGEQRYRLIVIGRKKLPTIAGDQERIWAFVQKVARKPEEIEDDLGLAWGCPRTNGRNCPHVYATDFTVADSFRLILLTS